MNTPSSRFRVRQHIDALLSRGVAVREFIPMIDKYRGFRPGVGGFPFAERLLYAGLNTAKLAVRIPPVVMSWRYEIAWLERELLSGRATIETLLKKPIVFDVDDAI